MRQAPRSAALSGVSDLSGIIVDEPGPSPLRVTIIETNEFKRDGFVEALAKLHPQFITITFASVSECVSSSANPDVIFLRLGQRTSSRVVLEQIEELRSAFPGVPVMALIAE